METCPIFENKTINGTKKQGTMVNVKRLTSTPSKTFTHKKRESHKNMYTATMRR